MTGNGRKSNLTRMLFSISVGVTVGGILSYFYQSLMRPSYILNLWSLTTFISIPAFAGFVGGFIDRENAMQNGIFIGVGSGTITSLFGAYLISEYELSITQQDAFSLFRLMTVFLWMIIASATARLAKEHEKSRGAPPSDNDQ